MCSSVHVMPITFHVCSDPRCWARAATLPISPVQVFEKQRNLYGFSGARDLYRLLCPLVSYITVYFLFIGISRENRKFPENFLFCFDFTINSKYVILFHFESNQKSSKKREKSANIWELEGGKATLPPEGAKVALPPCNKGEQEIFKDDKGCNWNQNGIKNHDLLNCEKICII